MATREPFPENPEDFNDDPRISYSKTSETYILEAEDGSEWEWNTKANNWMATMSEEEIKMQGQVYKMDGVDGDAPAMDLRKRKADDEDGANGKAKKQKPAQPPKERVNTAIYVTSLPEDVDVDELNDVFKKYGVIQESIDDGAPRIKLYHDEDGKFKGEALIVYFRPESVKLAINMLDGTDFRIGQKLPTGDMRVHPADASFKSQKEQPLATEQAKKRGTAANKDRSKAIKKRAELEAKLADWDDDDPQTIPDTSSRWDKVVVLKKTFILKDLAEDASAESDIKDDIREECEKFGTVSNVTLYDKEEDGVMTVRFSDATAAKACVQVFNGRWFDGRQIKASIADGNEKFKKTSKHAAADDPEEEARRLEQFSKDIEGEDEA